MVTCRLAFFKDNEELAQIRQTLGTVPFLFGSLEWTANHSWQSMLLKIHIQQLIDSPVLAKFGGLAQPQGDMDMNRMNIHRLLY